MIRRVFLGSLEVSTKVMLFFNHLRQIYEEGQIDQRRAGKSLIEIYPPFLSNMLQFLRALICKPKLSYFLLRVSYRSFFNNKHRKGWMRKCIYGKRSKRRLLYQKREICLQQKTTGDIYVCQVQPIQPTLKCKTEQTSSSIMISFNIYNNAGCLKGN